MHCTFLFLSVVSTCIGSLHSPLTFLIWVFSLLVTGHSLALGVVCPWLPLLWLAAVWPKAFSLRNSLGWARGCRDTDFFLWLTREYSAEVRVRKPQRTWLPLLCFSSWNPSFPWRHFIKPDFHSHWMPNQRKPRCLAFSSAFWVSKSWILGSAEKQKTVEKQWDCPLTIKTVFHFFPIATRSPQYLLASGWKKYKIIVSPLSMEDLQFAMYMASSKWEFLRTATHIYWIMLMFPASRPVLPDIWPSLKPADKIITSTAIFLIRQHCHYDDTWVWPFQ